MGDKFRVTLRKSAISHTSRTRGTVRALGLHRIGETVEVPDNAATRGMARAVRFLVEVEETGATPEQRPVQDGPARVVTDGGEPA